MARIDHAGAGIHSQTHDPPHGRAQSIWHAIEHAAHLLPTQTPLRVFVHHNPLHAFEGWTFPEAVKRGAAVYGTHAYLAEDIYRQALARGRIKPGDISDALLEDLGDEADQLVACLGTRHRLRAAMLQYPLRIGSDVELRWLIAETDTLRRFRDEAGPGAREQLIAATRQWTMRDLCPEGKLKLASLPGMDEALFRSFLGSRLEQWTSATWEAFTLHLLWAICRAGVARVNGAADAKPAPLRHRDCLLEATGVDTDRLVHEPLVRFCAAFLDQGIAHWTLPGRDLGFLPSWLGLNAIGGPVEPWQQGLAAESRRIQHAGLGPLAVIQESLDHLGITAEEEEEFLLQTLLALRGWAGMCWQMETNAEWTAHPAPRGTLAGFVAARLILERFALGHVAREALGDGGNLAGLRRRLRARAGHDGWHSVEQRAFLIFQLAQARGWTPESLLHQTESQWSRLVWEIEAFSSLERRRVFHLAFERRYRHQTLDAMLARAARPSGEPEKPDFQVVCCIDEREESFRRHLEEVAPRCETFGIAGFFGVAMYYKGVADAHYVPLCPVVIKPRHYLEEEVIYSFEHAHRRRAELRRALGMARHWLHASSRWVIVGALSAVLGTIASIPLIARVMFPRVAARIGRLFGGLVRPPAITRLTLERIEEAPGPQAGHQGYSITEMVDIARRVLEDMGLTRRFARLVILLGHGSSSLNNPHESAHDCGACGGGRGGPNARAIAMILSDPRVRERLFEAGLCIPRVTVFLGGYHNTCDDAVEYFDLDRLPSSHHQDFEIAKQAIDEARRRNAQERCRRFESAALTLTPNAALRHVETRAEDLSQVRPEYGHATNAICFVGRRARVKGLFLDRRWFLTSYDPTRDGDAHPILTRILQAVIPVCAGINLEYYFAVVDPTGYGCGTKLPHNISGLVGVMDGAASDLRPGLPWQMVEIHEPVRILFVVEATPATITGILERNHGLATLVHNDWVQLATLDPSAPAAHLFRGGRFLPYVPETTTLESVRSSVDWFRGWRDHLGYALVEGMTGEPAGEKGGARG